MLNYYYLIMTFCVIINYVLENTLLRMYVEWDKGTGRFITSLGVYVCGFIPTIDSCNSLYY